MNSKQPALRLALCLLLLAGLLSLTSCLPVPLGDPDKSSIDAKLTGAWNLKENDGGTLIAIAPADSHVYLVQMLRYKKTGDVFTAEGSIVTRAWLTEIKSERFLCSETLSQMLDQKTATKTYAIFRLRDKAEGMEVTPLNEKFDGFKDVKDSAALASALADHLTDAAMYTDASTFHRLSADKPDDAALLALLDK